MSDFDIIQDNKGIMHPFSTDTGKCIRHDDIKDCLSYLMMFGFKDTGIRV